MWSVSRRLCRPSALWKLSRQASTGVRFRPLPGHLGADSVHNPLRRLLALLNVWSSQNRCRLRLAKVFVPSFSVALWGSSTSAKMTAAEATKKCDELYEAGKILEAHEVIMALENDPDPEVQWRVVRMKFKVAEKTGTPDDVAKAIVAGIPKLQAILEKTPNCANTHKWLAILLGSKQRHSSFKEQIEEAFVIRKHMEKAVELNPKDGYSHYILGKWCFQVASVSWYQKKIAATLFASPPESTFEIALGHFKDAERCKPDIFSTCHLMAAQCLLNMNKKDEAAEYLKKCIAQEKKDAESQRNADEARKLAKKHSIRL